MSGKIPTYILTAVICVLFLSAGCTQSAAVALKFTAGDSTNYKVITEAQDGIQFEGSLLDDPALRSKSNQRNNYRTEITFNQRIRSIDDKGDADVNITIEELKCLSIYQNNSVLDLNSSSEKDKNNPLTKLIGQSYTIKITPTGHVVSVVDANEARSAAGDSPQSNQRALMLLSEDSIKERHSMLSLPAAKANTTRVGEKWSSIKTFTFRQMGPKSYERIYALKKILNTNDKPLADIEMNAIPSSETAQELHQGQAMSLISNMFDNIETYTGRLQFDLTAGRIEKYCETLRTEWIMANPNPKKDEEPGVIKMKAVRFYSLEHVD